MGSKFANYSTGSFVNPLEGLQSAIATIQANKRAAADAEESKRRYELDLQERRDAREEQIRQFNLQEARLKAATDKENLERKQAKEAQLVIANTLRTPREKIPTVYDNNLPDSAKPSTLKDAEFRIANAGTVLPNTPDTSKDMLTSVLEASGMPSLGMQTVVPKTGSDTELIKDILTQDKSSLLAPTKEPYKPNVITERPLDTAKVQAWEDLKHKRKLTLGEQLLEKGIATNNPDLIKTANVTMINEKTKAEEEIAKLTGEVDNLTLGLTPDGKTRADGTSTGKSVKPITNDWDKILQGINSVKDVGDVAIGKLKQQLAPYIGILTDEEIIRAIGNKVIYIPGEEGYFSDSKSRLKKTPETDYIQALNAAVANKQANSGNASMIKSKQNRINELRGIYDNSNLEQKFSSQGDIDDFKKSFPELAARGNGDRLEELGLKPLEKEEAKTESQNKPIRESITNTSKLQIKNDPYLKGKEKTWLTNYLKEDKATDKVKAHMVLKTYMESAGLRIPEGANAYEKMDMINRHFYNKKDDTLPEPLKYAYNVFKKEDSEETGFLGIGNAAQALIGGIGAKALSYYPEVADYMYTNSPFADEYEQSIRRKESNRARDLKNKLLKIADAGVDDYTKIAGSNVTREQVDKAMTLASLGIGATGGSLKAGVREILKSPLAVAKGISKVKNAVFGGRAAQNIVKLSRAAKAEIRRLDKIIKSGKDIDGTPLTQAAIEQLKQEIINLRSGL